MLCRLTPQRSPSITIGIIHQLMVSANGYERIHLGSGAYTFDSIYRKGDRLYVVESKGGGGALGGKSSVDIEIGEAIFVQQGTREYLERTIQDMSRSNRRLANQLQDALDDGSLNYLLARQTIRPDGSLGGFILNEFNI